VSPGLAGCQVKAALFKRIGRPGIAGPKACAGRTEPSNNASPHHGAEKLSIARADYLLAERVSDRQLLRRTRISRFPAYTGNGRAVRLPSRDCTSRFDDAGLTMTIRLDAPRPAGCPRNPQGSMRL
jgi:hypothetical protein